MNGWGFRQYVSFFGNYLILFYYRKYYFNETKQMAPQLLCGAFIHMSCRFQQFLNAVGADIFSLEVDHIPGIITENAGGLVFF